MVTLKRFFLFFLLFSLLFSSFSFALPKESLYFINLAKEYSQGSEVRFTFYTSHSGEATLALTHNQSKEKILVVEGYGAKSGNNDIHWAFFKGKDNPLPQGEYTLTLAINGEKLSQEISLQGIDNLPASVIKTEEDGESSATEYSSNENKETLTGKSSAENAFQDPVFLAKPSQTLSDSSSEKENTPYFSPNDYSPYDCDHENCFWKLPMGEMNEQAIWQAMMMPITVVKATRDTAGDRQSFNIYAEADENARVVAEVTAVSQGLHVLKEEGEWTLVEGYSSSFSNSRVKNYGGFFQGYIKSSRLETKTPNEKYGLLVDKLTQKMHVLKDGKIFSELLISTGLPNTKQPYNETPAGDYLVVSWTGGFYSGNMYCDMALRINAGILFHEVPCLLNSDNSRNYAPFEPLLGQKASHGCIRVQRALTTEETNMRWLWDNLKNNTRVFIWEDKGRMREIPKDDTPIYYNEDGGKYYHSDERCFSVRDKYLPLSPLTYGQLEDEPFNKLTPCPSCNPPMPKAEIEALNKKNAHVVHDGADKPVVVVKGDLPLYYNPDGGMYYHGEENCSTVSKKYLPLKPFTYVQLYDVPYKDLLPCPSCNPPGPGAIIDEENTPDSIIEEEADRIFNENSPSTFDESHQTNQEQEEVQFIAP